MVFVVNKRDTAAYERKPGLKVYIGRPSIFGNPVKTGTQDEMVAGYKTYFEAEIGKDGGLRRAMDQLKAISKKQDVYLLCWCKPKPCHGDILKAWLDN